MALPKELPPHWLKVPLEVSYGTPIMDPRSGAIKFNSFNATILADYPEMVELDDGEKLRLYPKNGIAYLSAKKAFISNDAVAAVGNMLVTASR
jgi:hypothetical protein